VRDFHLFDRPGTDMAQMLQDSVVAGSWVKMRKGDKTFSRTTNIIAMLLLILVIGAIFLVRAAGAKVDFEKHQPAFFTSLVADVGQTVKVQELDVYFHNGWYYYDVTYTTNGAGPLRRVYSGRDGIEEECFDPEITPIWSTARQLFESYKLAVSKGEHKAYAADEISSGLAQAIEKM